MAGTPAPALGAQQATRILNAVMASLRVVLRSPTLVQPGEALQASLVPASPQIDATELVNGVLNVALLTKDVTFNNPNMLNVPEAGDLAGDTLIDSVVPGGGVGAVQGMLGQLFGTFAVPNLKVGLEVRWVVRNQAGDELHEEGGDFVAPGGVASPDLSVLIPPLFGEMRLDTVSVPPVPDVYCLSARVRLSIGDVSVPAADAEPHELPAVPVAVARLLIPTVVAIYSEPFLDVAFGGQAKKRNDDGDVEDIEDILDSSVVVAVPEHSPFSSAEALFGVLRRVESALDALRGIAGVASFLLPLGDIASIPEQPRFRFSAKDKITDFHDVKLKPKKFLGFTYGYQHFDDRAYSIVVMGLPGTVVEFFNDVDFRLDRDQGSYAIRIGAEGFVVVRTLDTSDEEAPVTLPPGRVASFTPDRSEDSDGLWHTDMSSMRFAPGWLAGVGRERRGPPNLACLDVSVGADLAVRFDADPRRVVATAINNGPADATDVFVQLLASGAALRGAQASQGSTSGSDGLIEWEVGNLAVEAEATLMLTPRPTSMLWSAEAAISANELDPDIFNNRTELHVQIGS